MHKYSSQKGAALILLIGITAALAILSATLVFVIANQQRATASDRSSKQSLYSAEAALDSAVQWAKVNNFMSTTDEWLTPTELEAAFAGAFPAGATVTFRVYDNLAAVDYNIKWDQNADHRVWVEATVLYQGKTSRTRALVQQTKEPFAAALPKAVTYSDTGIRLEDYSDIYAVKADGTPDTSGSPYPTSITAGGTWTTSMPASYAEVGRFTTNSSTDLAAPGTSTQSLGITTNGSVSLAGTVINSAPGGTITGAGKTFNSVIINPGTVGFLSDYFDQAAQTELAEESQDAYPVRANAGATSVSSYYFSRDGYPDRILSVPGVSYDPGTRTYTFAQDLYVTGDLTLAEGSSPNFLSGTKFNFKSLYVRDDLNVTGQVTLNTTALYVGRDFTITGPSSSSSAVTHSLGSVYVKATPTSGVGSVRWSGYASVSSRDYTNPTAEPQPMWLGQYWSRTGTYNDEYGKIWVPGNSGSSVVFGSSGASSIMCPLLCTTEKTTASGNITFGSREKPMVYFFMCDNNGIYPQVVDWSCTGTYYGLMVINESTIRIRNGATGTPSVEGAIFAGCPYDPTYTSGLSKSDIVLEDRSSIAYNQAVVGAIATSSLKTTTLVTQVVPGSWQQLPVN